VNGSETPHQIHGVDPDDRAIGKQLGENAERDTILGIVERRNEYRGVGDVEVGVTGG